MQVIPAIDIRNGKCTRLVEGDYEREVQFDDDPVDAARRWVGMGAEMLHVVDLDGAKDGLRPNSDVVKRVITASGVPVQVGGGIRSLADADALLDAGASRVVFGTTLVEDPDTVAEAVSRFGADKVAVSIDAKDGEVRTRGWLAGTGIDAVALAQRAVKEIGVKTIIYTDTARDGTLTGPNLKQVSKVAHEVRVITKIHVPRRQPTKRETGREERESTGIAPGRHAPNLARRVFGRHRKAPSISVVMLPSNCEVIAAGGVSSIDDLLQLQEIGVAGAITGMAIYTGQIDLAEAIRAVNADAASR